jgi:formylglycine-generating enzyme required for sulfatase activity
MAKPKTLNLKKKKKKLVGKRELFVVLLAVIMTTLGIKASDTLMGDKKEAEMENGFCPTGMTLVPFSQGDFCIDLYEASAAESCASADPNNQSESRYNIDDPDCLPVSAFGKRPWRNISQDQATRACAKAGKRLATNQEWLQAALGTPDKNAPWGINDCQVDSNWERQPGLTGSGAKCLSSFGAYDMIGNVWEWVEGVVEDGFYEGRELPESGFVTSTDGQGLTGTTDPAAPSEDYGQDYHWLKTKGLRGMVRGGYWQNGSDAGSYSLYAVTPPSSAEPGIGFRCVK